MGADTLRSGFLYVITHVNYPLSSKIGLSVNPERRIIQANTWCPHKAYELKHFEFFDDVRLAEYTIHERLDDLRLPHGEWFSLPFKEAIQEIKKLKMKEGTL